MSTHEFERAVKVEQLSKASKVWFPRWIGRFAAYVKCARRCAHSGRARASHSLPANAARQESARLATTTGGRGD